MVLVVDSEGIVYALNDFAKSMLREDGFTVSKKAGEILNCINAKVDSGGCGYSPGCKECILRKNGIAAIEGNSVHRAKARMNFFDENKEVVNISLLISSAPMEYEGIKLAIIVIEDVSNISELQGLLPICCSCKKIRDDDGYWNQVEKYIEKHSEAEFTHGYCPECIEKLYPQFVKRVNQGQQSNIS